MAYGHLAPGLAVAAEVRYATVGGVGHQEASPHRGEPAAHKSTWVRRSTTARSSGRQQPTDMAEAAAVENRAKTSPRGRYCGVSTSASWGAWWVPYPGQLHRSSGGQWGAGILDSVRQGPFSKLRRFLVLFPGCLNLFWQVRRQHAVGPATRSKSTRTIQTDCQGTNACTRRRPLGREIADRTENYRRGEMLPCWPGAHNGLTGQPTRGKELHLGDSQGEKTKPGVTHSVVH